MRETFQHLQKEPSFFMSIVANLYQYLFVFLLMYVMLNTLVAINENAFFDARYCDEYKTVPPHPLACTCVMECVSVVWCDVICRKQLHTRMLLSPRIRALIKRLG